MVNTVIYRQTSETMQPWIRESLYRYLNSLWPSDAIWRQGSRSSLVQVMACCLTAPSHYQASVDLSSLRSSDVHLRAISLEISQPSVTKILKLARGQWVNRKKRRGGGGSLYWNRPLAAAISSAQDCGIETVSADGRSARPARLGGHPIWWRWHGNTKSLSKVQYSDV